MTDLETATDRPPLRVVFMGSPEFAVPIFVPLAPTSTVLPAATLFRSRAARAWRIRPP